jgi:lipopolysaccharide export system protein LptA
MMRSPTGLLAGVAALFLLSVPGAFAEGLNFGNGSNDRPIEVTADNGIEWEQDDKLFTARGNAVAVQGDLTVKSNELRAYYRPKSGGSGGTDIWRVDASGNVKITSPNETATGDNAVYDLDKSVMVLSGKKVRYATPDDEIIADRQIEYWDTKQMAVARGNAYAIRQDRRIKADVLVAHFKTVPAAPVKGKPAPAQGQGENKVDRVEAFDNVTIVTQTETLVASRADYVPDTGIANLTGNVKITRGQNQLDGCRAVVNMKTGISTMLSCKPGEGDSRVRGILVPDKRQ